MIFRSPRPAFRLLTSRRLYSTLSIKPSLKLIAERRNSQKWPIPADANTGARHARSLAVVESTADDWYTWGERERRRIVAAHSDVYGRRFCDAITSATVSAIPAFGAQLSKSNMCVMWVDLSEVKLMTEEAGGDNDVGGVDRARSNCMNQQMGVQMMHVRWAVGSAWWEVPDGMQLGGKFEVTYLGIMKAKKSRDARRESSEQLVPIHVEVNPRRPLCIASENRCRRTKGRSTSWVIRLKG
ncbi:hypothetical protein EW146_g9693 [Bondarzewia mesenterica]|uniref:Uncharacterized protein n=1 Tax=Bondarzewia mesenterica TaxID=1095465 RepID=A0A4S4L452_9AGAM|nr:hypothetical protein EW146_g9693 [Bondarzewia mesenterica]